MALYADADDDEVHRYLENTIKNEPVVGTAQERNAGRGSTARILS